MDSAIDDLDPRGTLARVERRLVERRAGELEDLRLAAHWAALHSTDPRRDPGYRRVPGADKLVHLGGEGTPQVRELCLAELAIAQGRHPLAARRTVADVLDLQHRLPQTWAVVEALSCDAWVAAKVARMSRSLSLASVALVDAAVARVIGSVSPGRVLTIAEAAVIEADPAAQAEKLEAELRRRYVGLSRTDQVGLRTVVARVEAGDAAWLDAMVDRLADILDGREDLRPDTPRDLGRDELRSLAFGWLARPAEALQLLLESAKAIPEPEPEALEESRSTAMSERALALLERADLSKLGPQARLFVHVHEDVLSGSVPGVARVEGIGPVLLQQLASLLGHASVALTPVIDLAEREAVDGYEFPARIRTRVRLVSPAEAFPHSNSITGVGKRGVDLDHPVEYDEHGPPGQTGDHNAQPLGRANHRARTHLPYFVWMIDSTTRLWRTPNGLWRVVDHTGTHLPASIELDYAA